MASESRAEEERLSTAEVIIEAEIDPRQIYYLRFWLEAHGHLAWLSTLRKGRVRLLTSLGNAKILQHLLRKISSKLALKTLKIRVLRPQNFA